MKFNKQISVNTLRGIAIVALFALSRIGATAQAQEPIQLLDISLSPGGLLMIGTNTYRVAESGPQISNQLSSADALAFHTQGIDALPSGALTNILSRIARHGLPVFIVDHDEESALTPADVSQKRSLTISSDRLSRLLSTVSRDKPGASTSNPHLNPVLSSSIEFDPDTGEYGLSRVELGILGRKVWFVHESSPNEDAEGTSGIRFKKAW